MGGLNYRAEVARQRIVKLVMVIYWLLIFEGAMRKWLFPQYHQIIFFIRDPFVLVIYGIMFRHMMLPKAVIFVSILILSIILIILIPVYVAVYNLSPIIPLYGWRNYFFYIPLAFLIGKTFKQADITDFIKQNLWVAMPMALLIVVQFASPPSAFINKSIAEDALVFTVVGDIVRTTGTFTFAIGQTLYCVCMLSLVVSEWLKTRKVRALRTVPFVAASFAAITMVLLAGSRTAFLLSGLVIVLAIFGGLGSEKQKGRSILLIGLFSSFSIILFTTVFSTSLDAMKERQALAVAAEGRAEDRVLRTTYAFLSIILDTPIIGYGLGFGTNAGTAVATGVAKFTLAEDEWSRIILEIGPLLGLLYILFRVYLCWWLFKPAFNRARAAQDYLPLLLLGAIGPILLNGQLTMQGTVNGFGWIFCGLIIASLPLGKRRSTPRES